MSNKPKILLVEDDSNLGFVVKDNLMKDGFDPVLCIDGNQGLKQFLHHKFDLCVLDVMLPEKDGFTLAEDIRNHDRDIPILFLTAKSMIEDKIKGFEIGGDDYLTKPFEYPELSARIKAILKRSVGTDQPVDKSEFKIGIYTYDSENLMLHWGEEVQKLTKKEGQILKLLCMHQGQVVKRNFILNKVWGKDDYFSGRSMDVFISKLRKYLCADSSIEIANLHGVGFKLVVNK